MSALPWIFGDDIQATPEKFSNVENQTEVWRQAQTLDREIARKLGEQLRM